MARSAAPRLGDTTSPQGAGLPFRLRGAEQRRGGGSGASVLSQGTVPVGRPAAPRPTYVRPRHGGPRLHGNEGASPGIPAPGLCPDRPRETTFPDAGRVPGSQRSHLLSPQNCFSISEHLSSPHTHTQNEASLLFPIIKTTTTGVDKDQEERKPRLESARSDERDLVFTGTCSGHPTGTGSGAARRSAACPHIVRLCSERWPCPPGTVF